MTFTVCNELFVNEPDIDAFERNFGASMHGTLPNVEGLVTARLLAPTAPDRLRTEQPANTRSWSLSTNKAEIGATQNGRRSS